MKYVISQVAFSGNKGASGMAKALIQNLRELDPEAKVYVLSYYPKADRRKNLPGDVEIVDGSPRTVLIRSFLSFWIYLFRLLHLPEAWYLRGAMKPLGTCDLWIDAAGISFVDGREKFTIFNLLSIFPALATGRKIVKAAQAMGPFEHTLNRLLAKFFLPRMTLIAARGDQTARYLEPLHLKNIVRYSDVAFSLRCSPENAERVSTLLPPEKQGKLIGISPSQVVYALCSRQKISYLPVLRDFIQQRTAEGFHCVVFPHSARQGISKRHNNDLPVLQELKALLPENEAVSWVDQELSDCELRMLIGRLDFLVASRFHAIISAMSTGIPTVVIGWSHKYAEVLSAFGLEQYCIGYADLSADNLQRKFQLLTRSGTEIRTRTSEVAKQIREQNRQFFRQILELADRG